MKTCLLWYKDQTTPIEVGTGNFAPSLVSGQQLELVAIDALTQLERSLGSFVIVGVKVSIRGLCIGASKRWMHAPEYGYGEAVVTVEPFDAAAVAYCSTLTETTSQPQD